MAKHDTVVKAIVRHHEDQGDDVKAELEGYRRPPVVEGSRGGHYIPDVLVNGELAYEVKDYQSVRNAVPKIKAITDAPDIQQCIVVLSTGAPKGVTKVRRYLRRSGVDSKCEVKNYRNQPFWKY